MFVELGYEVAGDVDVSFKSASTVRVNSPTGNAELPRAGLINRYAQVDTRVFSSCACTLLYSTVQVQYWPNETQWHFCGTTVLVLYNLFA